MYKVPSCKYAHGSQNSHLYNLFNLLKPLSSFFYLVSLVFLVQLPI